MSGTLFVVATPIGNLGDISPRACETLRAADLIAAEDTRHTQRLLNHLDVRTPLVACHDHNERATTEGLVRRLSEGADIALVSDAGTPLISDPGFHLVRQAHAAGLKVVPIPGPCALIAGLCASGLPSDRFVFEGFLPAKSGARRSHLERLRDEPRTLIVYEAPHRLLECLEDLVEVFGAERPAVLARELTKLYETIRPLPLAALRDWVAADSQQQRGECVLMLGGCPEPEGLDAESLRILKEVLAELPLKPAVSLAARITGQRRNQLYEAALRLQE